MEDKGDAACSLEPKAMSFFVSRAVAACRSEGSHDRADVFARGETAVLVVADGAGGRAGAAEASDAFVSRVREAVLDPDFDLLSVSAWEGLFRTADAALLSSAVAGETTAVVVVLATGVLLAAFAGDSEAWLVRPSDVVVLTARSPRARLGSGGAPFEFVLRSELDGRLVVATDGLFRHVSKERILTLAREERFGRVADALVEAARPGSGKLADDVAVLVAEP